jgi:DNA-binding transcriptional LysR family regulator
MLRQFERPVRVGYGFRRDTWFRSSGGLAYLTEWNVAVDLEAGTLVRVLEDWTPPLDGLCLYYPGRRPAPARTDRRNSGTR